MLQNANDAGLLTSLPTVEEVLGDHAPELGHDLTAYRNQMYRVVNLCLVIAADNRVEPEKITVAAVSTTSGSGRTVRSTTSLRQSRSRASTSRL